MAPKMYTGSPARFLIFVRNGALKLYVQNVKCFRMLVCVTYAVDVSNDFPGKRTIIKLEKSQD